MTGDPPLPQSICDLQRMSIQAWEDTWRRPCGERFDFFVGCVTSCGRPEGHEGVHHPVPLALDGKP